MSELEQVVPGPLAPSFTKEQQDVAKYRPPSPHRIAFKRKVFELEQWISAQGWVEQEDAIAWAQKRFNVERPQAKQYVNEAVKDFERLGKVRGRENRPRSTTVG